MKKENTKLFAWLKITFIFLLMFAYIPFIFAQSGEGMGANNADTIPALTAFKNNDLVRIIFGNPGESIQNTNIWGTGTVLGETGAIVVHLCFWAIFFVAFSDIFGSFLPFTNKAVPWIVGGAFTIAFANLGFIPWIVVNIARITAGLGAASVIASMGLAFVFFFLSVLFGNWLKITMLNRRRHWAANEGEHQARDAIENLIKLDKGFQKGA